MLNELGRVDVLFNNAGIFGRPAPIADVAVADWQTVVDTNLTGSFLCASEPVIHVDHVGRAVLYMASLPLEANVQSITVMATGMPFVGRG